MVTLCQRDNLDRVDAAIASFNPRKYIVGESNQASPRLLLQIRGRIRPPLGQPVADPGLPFRRFQAAS